MNQKVSKGGAYLDVNCLVDAAFVFKGARIVHEPFISDCLLTMEWRIWDCSPLIHTTPFDLLAAAKRSPSDKFNIAQTSAYTARAADSPPSRKRL